MLFHCISKLVVEKKDLINENKLLEKENKQQIEYNRGLLRENAKLRTQLSQALKSSGRQAKLDAEMLRCAEEYIDVTGLSEEKESDCFEALFNSVQAAKDEIDNSAPVF